MPISTGRERQWDFVLDGIGYRCVENEQGVPIWGSQLVPRIASEGAQIAEEERQQLSWHSGFGYSHALAGNTYWYSSGGCDLSKARQLTMAALVTTFAASGTVTGFVELGTKLYSISGRYLENVDTSADSVTTPNNTDYTLGFDAGSGTTLSAVVPWDSLLTLFFSSDTVAYTYNGSVAPTQLTTNSIKGVYAATAWAQQANAYTLARSYTASGDPAIAWIAQGVGLDSTSWTAAYDVGDDTKAITGVAGGQLMYWIAKVDGLYYIAADSGRSVRVFSVPIDSNNGKGLFVDTSGQVWYPSAFGLYRYNPFNGNVADVTPGRGLGLGNCPIYGDRWSIAQYKGWYYCSVYNGTDSYLMLGREREEGEPGIGPMIWHGALAKASSALVQGLYVYGGTNPPRLYWGSGTNISYIRLPAKADNQLQSSASRYSASGSTYFPAENMGTAAARWNLAGIIVEAEGFNTDTYGDFYAMIDKGTSYVLIGRLQAGGRVFIPIPSGDWRFSNITLRLDITNASSTTTPVIRAITMLATRRVYTRKLIETTVWCSERVLGHMGAPPVNSLGNSLRGQELYDHIERLTVQGPVELHDWWTANERVQRVLVQPVRELLVKYHGTGEAAMAASFAMVAQTSETVSVDAAPPPAPPGTGPLPSVYGVAIYGQGIYA